MRTSWKECWTTPFGLVGALMFAVASAGAQEPAPVIPRADGPGAPKPGTPAPAGPFGRIERTEGGERVEIIIGEDDRLGGRGGAFDSWTASPFGAALATADETLRAQLEFPAGQGLVVTAVAPDSPAAKAGLQPGDILLTFDGKPLADVGDLAKAWHASEKPAPLTLIRAGKPLTIEVPAGRDANPGPDTFWIGIPVGKVDEVLRSHLDLPAGEGLVITGIAPESPAARAGLKPSDILLSFDGKPVSDARSLRAQIRSNEDKALPLVIIRAGKKQTIEVTPERRKAPLARVEFKAHAPGPFEGGGRVQFIGPGVVVPRMGPWPGVPLDAQGFRWSKRGGAAVDGRLDEILARLKAMEKSLDELKGASKGGAAVEK